MTPVPGADEPDELDLVRQLARRLRRTEVDTARWGLSPHQARALLALTRLADRGEGARVSELAGRLQVAPRSATEVADALEDRGLVERRPDPTDRRAVLLVPTARGRAVAREVGQERRRVSGRLLEALTGAERAELRRLLTRVLEQG